MSLFTKLRKLLHLGKEPGDRRQAAEDLLDRMIDMSFVNPKGFREPSVKGDRDRIPTAMEQLALASGLETQYKPRVYSKRGDKKRRLRANHVARSRIIQEHLEMYRRTPGVNRWAKTLPKSTMAELRKEFVEMGIAQ